MQLPYRMRIANRLIPLRRQAIEASNLLDERSGFIHREEYTELLYHNNAADASAELG
jgi:hypothetical protein